MAYGLFKFNIDSLADLIASLLMVGIPVISYFVYEIVKDNRYQYFTVWTVIIQTTSLTAVSLFIYLIITELCIKRYLLSVEPLTSGWMYSILYIVSLLLLDIRISIDLYKIIAVEKVVIYRYYWNNGTITTSDTPIENTEEINTLMHVQRTINNAGRYDYIRVNNYWKPNY